MRAWQKKRRKREKQRNTHKERESYDQGRLEMTDV
jgi:hypothetical protein